MSREDHILIAERLDWLFRNILKADGSEYTHQEVEWGTEQQGYKVSATAVWNIRRGKTVNPGILTLQALARFFHVPLNTFNDALSEQDLANLRDQAIPPEPQVREIALRARELDEDSQRAILDMIRLIARKEGHHLGRGSLDNQDE